MTDHEKARLYDKLVSLAVKINDWGSLFHYQITLFAMKNQTFEEALVAVKPAHKDSDI